MRLQWNWGTGVAAVYIVFALATSAVVVFSMRERVDLVSDDYYDQAVALDARRQAEARAAALGARFTILPEAAAERVVVTWPRNMPIESGTLTLYRPSDATKDRVVEIARSEDGRQTVALAGLAPGRWLLQVKWRAGGQAFYAERAIVAGAAR